MLSSTFPLALLSRRGGAINDDCFPHRRKSVCDRLYSANGLFYAISMRNLRVFFLIRILKIFHIKKNPKIYVLTILEHFHDNILLMKRINVEEN